MPAPAPINRAERFGVLLVPWTFIVLFGGLYVELLLPRVREGHLVGVVLGVLVTFALIVSIVAAVTFSRDVLLGRWP